MCVRVRVRLRLRPPPRTGGIIMFLATLVILFDGLFKLFIILFILLVSVECFKEDIQRNGGLIGSNTSKS